MTDAQKVNTETATPVPHGNIAAALAAAQAQMGKALKSANNPHFKKSYADLASVMDACMPSLSAHGIAVIQPTADDENGRYVETVLIHGETGETLKCRVPLIVQKNDMQGYGSAVTYARRYGLMSMAGIAPEDDDGNAAAKAPPKASEQPKSRQLTSSEVADRMVRDIRNATSLKKLQDGMAAEETRARIARLSPEERARIDAAVASKEAELETPNVDLGGDHIPYEGAVQ